MKQRILVVQESDLEAFKTATAIRAFGHEVLCASSSADAVQQLLESRFDAVVLDWVFAKDLLSFLRTDKRLESTPAIVLLDEPLTSEFVFDAYDHGSDLALVKPVEPEIWHIFSKF